MTAIEWFRYAVAKLADAGINLPEKEAEEMLSAIGIDRVSLFRDAPVLSNSNIRTLNEYLQKRLLREPLQYIIGYTRFMNLKIKTEKGVLIPRPETELLVLEITKEVKGINKKMHILDLCTGTGCIALSLAKELNNSIVYGTDLSEKAINLAIENAKLNGIKNVHFIQGDLFEPIRKLCLLFDIIVANPPYVKTGEIPFLEPEVRDWEPIDALDGGEDGTTYYKRIMKDASDFLKEDGWMFLELGAGLYKEVESLAKLYKLKHISVLKDLNGIERIFKCKKYGGGHEGPHYYG